MKSFEWDFSFTCDRCSKAIAPVIVPSLQIILVVSIPWRIFTCIYCFFFYIIHKTHANVSILLWNCTTCPTIVVVVHIVVVATAVVFVVHKVCGAIVIISIHYPKPIIIIIDISACFTYRNCMISRSIEHSPRSMQPYWCFACFFFPFWCYKSRVGR